MPAKKSINCAECKNEDSRFRKIAGTLTGDEIKKHGIISIERDDYAGTEESVKPTTYDLRLGDAHYVFDLGKSKNSSGWRRVFIGNNEKRLADAHNIFGLDLGGHRNSSRWRQVFIGDNENLKKLNEFEPKFEVKSGEMGRLIIPAFGSALVQLEEIVDTLSIAENDKILVVGRFDLKLSKVYQALISQQATQVEPYYMGKLFCFLHNLSTEEISISYKDPIATIEFSYVSSYYSDTERQGIIENLIQHNKNKYSDEFCFKGSGIKDIRWFDKNGHLPNDCGLASFHDAVKNTLQSKTKEIDEAFEKKFEGFIGEEETMKKLTERVEMRLMIRWKVFAAIITLISVLVTASGVKIYDFLRQKKTSAETQSEQLELKNDDSEASQ